MKVVAIYLVLYKLLYGSLATPVDALSIAPVASGAWSWYKSMLVTKPILTKSLTSSCIMSISDVMCQEVVSKAQSKPAVGLKSDVKELNTRSSESKLDTKRVMDVAITGLVWSGPITHYWYIILEKIYEEIAKTANIQTPAIGLFVRLMLDALIFSSVTITGYFTIRSMLEGSGMAGAKKKIETRFFTTLFGAWRFWPIANAVNFWFVPMQFRVLYMNILSLFWTGWLTYINSKK